MNKLSRIEPAWATQTYAEGTASIDNDLDALGCPYPNSDPRSSYWLEGRYHHLFKRREGGNTLSDER